MRAIKRDAWRKHLQSGIDALAARYRPMRLRWSLEDAEVPEQSMRRVPAPVLDAGAVLLRIRQKKPWLTVRFDDLNIRERREARQLVRRQILERPKRVERSTTVRTVVGLVAGLMKAITGKWPGYTHDWDSQRTSGKNVTLIAAAVAVILGTEKRPGPDLVAKVLKDISHSSGSAIPDQ